ncbi:TIGR03086 family metal-binding protein [Nocardioides caldifontis]|uniref:TIGR03086 family metal-binding protein n=1 Tax=Nocardioides caldifontis TaxID=2588938 RepID=UPI001EF08BC9|nr:TIGR03086 family metal-binding protein [Nocardioides caldifontis]
MTAAQPLTGLDPVARHREVAAGFTARVEGVPAGGWDAPAPVEGWAARDVVRHLVEWFPAFLQAGAGVALPSGPSVDDDPVAAWRVHSDGVQALLDDPATAERVLSNPHLGELPLPEAVDRFYTADVFMHTWDLARATGQDETLDPALCEELLAGMEPIEEVMRASGQYGPRVAVPEDATVQTRLLGFIGRHP